MGPIETQFSERAIFAAERYLELSYEEKGDWIEIMDEVLALRKALGTPDLTEISSSPS
jgi:hypothetical protein